MEGVGIIYPNLYVILVGHAGIGKTRAIREGTGFLREIKDIFIAPTSMKTASLVDKLHEAKCSYTNWTAPKDKLIEFNSLVIGADEMSAFVHEHDSELFAALTTFYDIEPYGQARRTMGIDLHMARPQLNILCGSTPSNLLRLMPEAVWEQGITSRIIMVYSEQKQDSIDIFTKEKLIKPLDMIHDLKVMHALIGSFGWTQEFADAYNKWRGLDEAPVPTHPRLRGYNSRRKTHMLKLAMVSSIDRGNDLTLSVTDFNQAMTWLLEAEAFMPKVFVRGTTSIDSRAVDEIAHFVKEMREIGEQPLIRFAKEHLPARAIRDVLSIMISSGMIRELKIDKLTGLRVFGPGEV